MSDRYLDTYFTREVRAAQMHYYGRSADLTPAAGPDPLGTEETQFVALRDSFYMATVTSDGWPYLQHRGGPAGFLKVLDEHTLGFADFKGNRQLVTTGNLAGDGRVALFLMDYPNRVRLKVSGQARVLDAREEPDLLARLAPSVALRSKIERLFVIDVMGFNWNCPQYITPRFTEQEVRDAVAPLKRRIAELEAQLGSRT